jgi:hypothetical protein
MKSGIFKIDPSQGMLHTAVFTAQDIPQEDQIVITEVWTFDKKNKGSIHYLWNGKKFGKKKKFKYELIK